MFLVITFFVQIEGFSLYCCNASYLKLTKFYLKPSCFLLLTDRCEEENSQCMPSLREASQLHNFVLLLCLQTVPTMRSVRVCFCLALLLPWCVQSQRDMVAVDILNQSGMLNSLLRSEHQTVLRRARPASQVPKRAQQGSRFALSLDVPTNILSVLIDLAKNQDMRTKAAANAELMARIGKRK